MGQNKINNEKEDLTHNSNRDVILCVLAKCKGKLIMLHKYYL